MLSKSSKWELGFVHYIAKFTISNYNEHSLYRGLSVLFSSFDKMKRYSKVFLIRLMCPRHTVPDRIDEITEEMYFLSYVCAFMMF